MEPDTESDKPRDRTDPAFEDMLGDLAVLYKRPVPNRRIELLVENAAQQNLAQKLATPQHSRKRLTGTLGSRLGGFALAAIAIAALVAAAYPGWMLVDRALNLTPTGRLVVVEGLAKNVHVSRTAQGFTITVERVYADPRGVIVGYTMSGPRSHSFHSFQPFGGPTDKHVELPVLRNGRGHELSGAMVSLTTGVDSGANGGALIFDASNLPRSEHVLRLTLSMQAITAIESVGNHPGSVRYVTIPGPFVFHLRIPYTLLPSADGWPAWTRAIGEAQGHFTRRSAHPK